MEGAARVFAGEFNAATLQVPGTGGDDAPWIVTPGGGWCRRLFLVGALTERVESGEMLRCRLADPTGAFDLVAGGRNSPGAAAIRSLPIPSFVSVTGSARMYQKNGTTLLSVRPDEVLPVGRPVRDRWVLTTAAHTLRRLELLEAALSNSGNADGHALAAYRHYATTPGAIRALLDMVDTAVKSIAPPVAGEPEETGPDARAVLMELLESAAGPRGMPIDELLDAAASSGISRDAALAAIEALVVGDECYQPQKGFLRLL